MRDIKSFLNADGVSKTSHNIMLGTRYWNTYM